MFSNISDFGFKRSGLQAVGFYIVYLILIVITSVLAEVIIRLANGNGVFEYGQKIGIIVAILFTLLFSFLILQDKKMANNSTYLVLAIVAGVLAFMGGGLLGLLIPAYFTTLGSTPSTKKKSKK